MDIEEIKTKDLETILKKFSEAGDVVNKIKSMQDIQKALDLAESEDPYVRFYILPQTLFDRLKLYKWPKEFIESISKPIGEIVEENDNQLIVALIRYSELITMKYSDEQIDAFFESSVSSHFGGKLFLEPLLNQETNNGHIIMILSILRAMNYITNQLIQQKNTYYIINMLDCNGLQHEFSVDMVKRIDSKLEKISKYAMSEMVISQRKSNQAEEEQNES